MPSILAAFTACFLLAALDTHATTWSVGPGRTHTTPSQVSALVANGDTVRIDAGTYTGDVCVWRAHRLTLVGEGVVDLAANDRAAEGKAIWVIKGDSCVVDNITFRDCKVKDMNGAGIRAEGTTLTVRNCVFRQNQDGILAGDNARSVIRVTQCEFDRNGAGDGYSHGIYVNHIKAFYYIGNYSHGTDVGHEVKSRAKLTYILFNRITQENGAGSRNIDLPNGGTALIMGNIIEKGGKAQNGTVIGYGLEGMTDTTYDDRLYVAHNTIVNARSVATLVMADTATAVMRIVNNLCANVGTMIVGSARSIDTAGTIRCTTAQAGLVDAGAYDYHLTDASPARGAAVDAGRYIVRDSSGIDRSLPLIVASVYEHVCKVERRLSTVDVGAYDHRSTASVNDNDEVFSVSPNPASTSCTIRCAASSVVTVYSVSGEVCHVATSNDAGEVSVDCTHMAPGAYIVRAGGHASVVHVVH